MSIPPLNKQANQAKKEKLLRYLGHPEQYDAVNEFVQAIRN